MVELSVPVLETAPTPVAYTALLLPVWLITPAFCSVAEPVRFTAALPAVELLVITPELAFTRAEVLGVVALKAAR